MTIVQARKYLLYRIFRFLLQKVATKAFVFDVEIRSCFQAVGDGERTIEDENGQQRTVSREDRAFTGSPCVHCEPLFFHLHFISGTRFAAYSTSFSANGDTFVHRAPTCDAHFQNSLPLREDDLYTCARTVHPPSQSYPPRKGNFEWLVCFPRVVHLPKLATYTASNFDRGKDGMLADRRKRLIRPFVTTTKLFLSHQ